MKSTKGSLFISAMMLSAYALAVTSEDCVTQARYGDISAEGAVCGGGRPAAR